MCEKKQISGLGTVSSDATLPTDIGYSSDSPSLMFVNQADEEGEEMKKLEDMTTEELVDWATGNLIVAIGQGKFRERVCGILLAVQQFSFARGHKQARKRVARA